MRKKKYYSSKRRYFMSLGEEIVHLEIFERDNWMCGICKEPINRYLRKPNWYCATLDHVLPMKCFTDTPSLYHTHENVQAAHLKCNLDKADDIMADCEMAP